MEISNNVQYRYNTNFNGLTRCLKKSVYNSESMINAFVEAHPNSKGFAGNFPKEFISSIKNNKNTIDVAKEIEKVKNSFSSVSSDLRKIFRENEYNCKKDVFKRLSFDDFLYAQADENEFGMLKALSKVNSETGKYDLITDDELKGFNTKLTKDLKDANVIPMSAKVKLSYIGGGSFGNALKMSFLDKNDKKLFHDKVLKVYKDVDEIEYQNKYAYDVVNNFVKQSTPEEYIKKINNIVENNQNKYRTISTDKLVENYDKLKSMEIGDLYGCYHPFKLAAIHGVKPEANAALFIKKVLGGDISITDMIEPHCFDLKNNYTIMEMADKELQTLKSVNLHNMGIMCFDQHNGNFVNDKLIDYGAIKVIDKDVLKNRKSWGNYKERIVEDY